MSQVRRVNEGMQPCLYKLKMYVMGKVEYQDPRSGRYTSKFNQALTCNELKKLRNMQM